MEISRILIIILICIGAVQGLVFGLILVYNKTPSIAGQGKNRLANRLLGTILFFLSYRLIVQTMRLFGLGYYDGWYYIMIDMSWITGALIYFYVKALTIPAFRIKDKDWLHFLPLVVQIGFSIFVRLQNLYWDGTRESLSWLGYWGYVVWMNNSTIYIVTSLLIIVYSFKALQLINQPNYNVKIDPERTAWIKRIIRSFQIYFVIVFLILIIDLLVFNIISDKSYFYFERFYYYPFFIGLSALTYWIGLEGFNRKDQAALSEKTELSISEKKYLENIAEQLNTLMQEKKVYKEANLTLQMLADILDIKAYLLTRTFKEILNTKFSDYINGYRLNEVKKLIQNPGSKQYTLLGLAFDAGFNSKSSFNRAVKKHLGISPNQLRSQI